MAGRFITFEGPEGAGKSTQLRLLAEYIRDRGLTVVTTREPGGTVIGEQIRAILLGRDSIQMAPETEALLHTAARAQHVTEVIKPALERGEIVLCDRFLESTLAYQGGGRGLAMDQLREVQDLATGGLVPDLRVLLDLDVGVGLQRRRGDAGSLNRMDHEEVDFHQRVRDAYLSLAAGTPDGWVVIDADREIESISADVRQSVIETLAGAGFDALTLVPVTS
jgi:dTMP kinase